MGCERVEPDGLTHGEASRGRFVPNSQANGEFDVERIVSLARSVWLNVGMSGDEDGRGGNAVGGDAGNCTIGADAKSRFWPSASLARRASSPCKMLSVSCMMSVALTVCRRPSAVIVMTVDSVRGRTEVRVCGPGPAAMLKSGTSQTGATAPSSRRDERPGRRCTELLRKKPGGREPAVTQRPTARIRY